MITVKQLGENEIDEFKLLLSLFNAVFENDVAIVPTHNYLINLLKQESFLVFAAVNNGDLAGGLTAFVLPQYHSQSASVYLYDLAVAIPYQRQGIGKLLITELNAYCKARNFKEVFVQTESDETTALSFYRSTGAEEMEVRHFTYHL